jgi:hypothetical protein
MQSIFDAGLSLESEATFSVLSRERSRAFTPARTRLALAKNKRVACQIGRFQATNPDSSSLAVVTWEGGRSRVCLPGMKLDNSERVA